MAILRDTRARIDPALLAAMKETLSRAMPNPPPTATESPVAAARPVFKEGLFKREYKSEAPAEPVPVQEVGSGMEPVDKQKIAQIVLEYMKNREDKQRH